MKLLSLFLKISPRIASWGWPGLGMLVVKHEAYSQFNSRLHPLIQAVMLPELTACPSSRYDIPHKRRRVTHKHRVHLPSRPDRDTRDKLLHKKGGSCGLHSLNTFWCKYCILLSFLTFMHFCAKCYKSQKICSSIPVHEDFFSTAAGGLVFSLLAALGLISGPVFANASLQLAEKLDVLLWLLENAGFISTMAAHTPQETKPYTSFNFQRNT